MPPFILAAALADLVLPRCCVGCGRAGRALCAACTPAGLLRPDTAGLSVVAAGHYAGALRAALIAYKERGRRDLAGPLGELLARTITGRSASILVPVPSASRVARARGGDHVLRLTRVAARNCLAGVATPLRLVRPVQDSAGLGPRERAANLHEAMTAGPPPQPGAVAVILDDIVTTGATLREASRALEAAGWSVCGAAAVAVTALRSNSGGAVPAAGRSAGPNRGPPGAHPPCGMSGSSGLTLA